jgi:hypothetical protein
MTPRLVIEQKITLLVNQYRLFAVDNHGQKAELIAFAQQKRFKFKEKILFYTDEQKSSQAFAFHAEKVLDVHGRYFVTDANGKTVGAFRKAFKKSLLSSTWHILQDDEPVLTVTENNKTFALIRRIVQFIPYISDLADILMPFLRYHFVFVDAATGEVVGKYRKTTSIRDHYELAMTDEAYESQDWRVFAAVAVALDALQKR